ncbi:hypothetical protein F7018_12300 [Tenacibaculum aiptasiae]|uniref:YobI-like P-loop NTPase domain-containing protein n=1 Tax=Tenacibaculum aiptasiae TaxID=426481 RepID=A0A7J5ACE4_9FLAO|nr:hypothetical protein [Tenacibaculum aiptasiae]KAB1155252.1 hypothetical protein F7018_12300 [Tenacibaculum aiptasiae]
MKKDKTKGYFDLNPLTPLVLDKTQYGVDTYLKSLKFGIDNKDIHNIALTGSYGSGKSSILKTFQNQHNEYEYLNISLASFIEDEKKHGADLSKKESNEFQKKVDSNNSIDRTIELSVLQQLFYREEYEKTPYSRFRKIKNINSNELSIKALIIAFFILITYFLFDDNFLNFIFKANSLKVKFVLSLLFLFGLHEILLYIFKFFNHNNINNLNLKKFEIGLSKDDDESILNKHLDEIIYFFEVTNYSVVIIEDLDRLKNTFIFTKLREINQLLNNSKQINRSINFIYATKDELFNEKSSRTKFFDLIIPVIPIINPYNSNDKAIEIINNLGKEFKLDNSFLTEICVYIDDMRLLNNISNEYVIYRKILSKKLNPEKLFSIIVYKNIHPDDFSLLNKNKGELYEILNSKNDFKEKFLDRINNKIKKLETKIDDLNEEKTNSYEELKSIYIYALLKKYPHLLALKIKGEIIRVNNLYKDENFRRFKNSSKEIGLIYTDDNVFEYSRPYVSLNSDTNIFSKIEKDLNNKTFDERHRLLFKKDIQGYQEKIRELNIKKNNIKKFLFHEIYNQLDENEKHILNNKSNKKLIFYLLRNNYINEDYFDYTSHFHGISLTTEENDYLQTVRNGGVPDYNFLIRNPRNFLKKLKNITLEKESIFNNSLLNYLIINKDDYKNELSIFIKRILKYDKASITFLDNYFDKGTEVKELVNILCEYNINFWDVVDNNNYWRKSKESYFSLLLKCLKLEDLKKIAQGSSLKEFISEKYDFINTFTKENSIEKIAKFLTGLKIKFKEITRPKNHAVLFNYVYDNYLYEINFYNITLFANYYLKNDFDNKKFLTKNYSYLAESNLISLSNYIEINIQDYLDNVYLKLDNEKEEKEEFLIRLLNNSKININTKRKLVNVNKTKIVSLKNISDENLKNHLFQLRKIETKWDNIFSYYKLSANQKISNKESIMISLEKYLNTPEIFKELADNERLYMNKYDELERETINSICAKILLNDNITNQSFWHLIHSITEVNEDFPFEKLNYEKVEILVMTRMKFNSRNYLSLRNNYPDLHLNLIEKNIDLFIENLKNNESHYIEVKQDAENFPFNVDDFNLLLKRNIINDKNIFSLLDFLDTKEIVKNQELTNRIAEILSKTDRMPFFIDFDLILAIFKNHKSINNKIVILNRYINRYKPKEIISLLQLLPNPYNQLLQKNKRVKIASNSENSSLIGNFQERNLISSHYFDGDYIIINMKRKKID